MCQADRKCQKQCSKILEQSLASVLDDTESIKSEKGSSEESEYESYACHCRGNKCHAEKRDFIASDDDADDPPIIYQPTIHSIESAESEVKIVAPKCQCANCALKNMCKSRRNVCRSQHIKTF